MSLVPGPTPRPGAGAAVCTEWVPACSAFRMVVVRSQRPLYHMCTLPIVRGRCDHTDTAAEPDIYGSGTTDGRKITSCRAWRSASASALRRSASATVWLVSLVAACMASHEEMRLTAKHVQQSTCTHLLLRHRARSSHGQLLAGWCKCCGWHSTSCAALVGMQACLQTIAGGSEGGPCFLPVALQLFHFLEARLDSLRLRS
jgi:hypothetical protein